MISVPVLPISDAKLCIRPRKALHLPTQSFAFVLAKLCIRSRKALHPLLQTFARKDAFIYRMYTTSSTHEPPQKYTLISERFR